MDVMSIGAHGALGRRESGREMEVGVEVVEVLVVEEGVVHCEGWEERRW